MSRALRVLLVPPARDRKSRKSIEDRIAIDQAEVALCLAIRGELELDADGVNGRGRDRVARRPEDLDRPLDAIRVVPAVLVRGVPRERPTVVRPHDELALAVVGRRKLKGARGAVADGRGGELWFVALQLPPAAPAAPPPAPVAPPVPPVPLLPAGPPLPAAPLPSVPTVPAASSLLCEPRQPTAASAANDTATNAIRDITLTSEPRTPTVHHRTHRSNHTPRDGRTRHQAAEPGNVLPAQQSIDGDGRNLEMIPGRRVVSLGGRLVPEIEGRVRRQLARAIDDEGRDVELRHARPLRGEGDPVVGLPVRAADVR